jgi:hypothetical protein
MADIDDDAGKYPLGVYLDRQAGADARHQLGLAVERCREAMESLRLAERQRDWALGLYAAKLADEHLERLKASRPDLWPQYARGPARDHDAEAQEVLRMREDISLGRVRA